MSTSFATTNRVLADTLDRLWLREQVLSANLANAETPGYKRLDLEWTAPAAESEGESPFRLALARTHALHFGTGGSTGLAGTSAGRSVARLVRDRETAVRNDGNNVDLEREMVLLTETSLWYQTTLAMLGRRLGMLRNVIREGR